MQLTEYLQGAIEMSNECSIFCFLLDGIVSYSAPEASDPAQGLSDSCYDGRRLNGELRDGLGRLVDGETGTDNFRLDIGYGKGRWAYFFFIIQKFSTYLYSQLIFCARVLACFEY